MKAGPNKGAGTKRKACLRAVEGQCGSWAMGGKGIVRMRWLNWIVFDHLLIMMAQSVKKSMSHGRRCLDGSNCVNPLHSKFALRRRPKKATRQTAQKVECEGLSKFK